MVWAVLPLSPLFQPMQAIAPSLRLFPGSATTRSGEMRISSPRPPQWGQAPKGELKENMRGESSSRLTPQSGQA